MIDNKLFEKVLDNDVDSLLELGMLFYNGNEGENSIGKSFCLFKKAYEIEPDNRRAVKCLANCYFEGIGTEKNESCALELYRKSANSNEDNSQYELATLLKEREDPECIVWFVKAYENGDIDAPFELAKIYRDGIIVPSENNLFAKWLICAAELENADALILLGRCYIEGDSFECNAEKGVELLKKVADRNNGNAAKMLYTVYRSDALGIQDMDEAERWAKKAAFLGEHSALCMLANEYKEGKNFVEANKEKAFELFLFDAMCDSPVSCINVAESYLEGVVTVQNSHRAEFWNNRAFELGINKLGISFQKENIVSAKNEEKKDCILDKKDDSIIEGKDNNSVFFHNDYEKGVDMFNRGNYDESIPLFEKAYSSGEKGAAFFLGKIYAEGLGGKALNIDNGMNLIFEAAMAGNNMAQYYIGACYIQGGIMEKNVEEGFAWLKMSASGGNRDAKELIEEFRKNQVVE